MSVTPNRYVFMKGRNEVQVLQFQGAFAKNSQCTDYSKVRPEPLCCLTLIGINDQ